MQPEPQCCACLLTGKKHRFFLCERCNRVPLSPLTKTSLGTDWKKQCCRESGVRRWLFLRRRGWEIRRDGLLRTLNGRGYIRKIPAVS
jgi:hypothetical protein